MQRKLQRQQDALDHVDEIEKTDAEGKPLSEKDLKAYRESVKKTIREQMQKTEASILRAEKALGDMERSPQIRTETEKALAAWRQANPNEAARALREIQQERDSLKKYVELLRQEAKLTTPEERKMLPSDVLKLARTMCV